MRNVMAHAGRSGEAMVRAFIGTAFAQDDAQAAKAQWRRVADQPRPKLPKPAGFLDEAETDVPAHMTLPRDHRPKIHSTNPPERLNGEIKRKTEVAGIFPNSASSPMKKRLSAWSAPSARTERRMGRPALPLHDPGNHRALER
jgi:putative transposase